MVMGGAGLGGGGGIGKIRFCCVGCERSVFVVLKYW